MCDQGWSKVVVVRASQMGRSLALWLEHKTIMKASCYGAKTLYKSPIKVGKVKKTL